MALDQIFSGASEDFPALLRRKGMLGSAPTGFEQSARPVHSEPAAWAPTESTTILAFKFAGAFHRKR